MQTPDELFETTSQALLNAVDRDALSGWGAVVHVMYVKLNLFSCGDKYFTVLSDFVRNEDVRHATQQPPLSSIVKTHRLSLFGHIARMNALTDASRILFEPLSEVWTKPRRRPCNSWVRTVTNDLANSYTGLPEARGAAQDRVYWRMFTKHSATHS